MAELKASEQGLKQIKQARDKKGWIVEDPRWLVEASKILDPDRDWEAEEGIYANGVSFGTWKAFSYNKGRKKGIRTEVYQFNMSLHINKGLKPLVSEILFYAAL